MSNSITEQLERNRAQLEQQRTHALRCAETVLLDAQNDGRSALTIQEASEYRRALREVRDLDAELREVTQRITEFEATQDRDRQIAASLARFSGTPDAPESPRNTAMQTTAATRVNDGHLTYRRHDRSVSWVRDMLAFSLNRDENGEARQRLFRHRDEVATDAAFKEFRDISRVDGQGGYAVPPAWLMEQYVELARPGRAFANLCQRLPLPGGTDSINIPKLLTGTEVGVQPADNTTVTDVDLTDTFINAPVRTISGQQGVSIQLIDQSPIAFDDVVFRDLVAAHAGTTDVQVMAGSGTNGQILGVDNTPGISTIAVSSVDVPGVYTAIANAIQLVHTTRFMPPEVIVMHPRRWGWLLAQLDDQHRPLFIPNAQGPFNAAGILTDVASQQIVGTVQGLPVVTDPNVTTVAGEGSPVGTEDQIYVLRASDLFLWESGIRSRVLPEVKSSTLTVVLQIYSYLAFSAARYPASVVTITGLSAPEW